MTSRFPRFDEPTAIDALRSWTATFESWDQRNDDVYYVVTIHEAGWRTTRFIVQIWLDPTDEGFADPAAVAEHLHLEIHKVAVTGKTNTSYIGAMVRPDDDV